MPPEIRATTVCETRNIASEPKPDRQGYRRDQSLFLLFLNDMLLQVNNSSIDIYADIEGNLE